MTNRERKHQRETDGVLRLADTELGIHSIADGSVNYQQRPPITSSRRGDSWAPYRTVEAPTPVPLKAAMPKTPRTGTAAWGASGTPITSGYLLDLGEYNPECSGRVAIPLWEKMRRGDAQVWATLRAAKQPQWSATWEVLPGVKPNDPGYKKAKEVADFVRDNLFGGLEFETSLGSMESQAFHSVLYNALLMLDFGCAVHEDVYAVDGGKIKLRALPSRLPLTFYRWHTERDGETLIALEQYGYRGDEYVNATLPANKMCRFTYNQEGANFFGISMLRPMYPHFYVCQALYRVDAIASERNGLGVPVITLGENFSEQDRAAAYGFVTQLAAHELTGLVLPPGHTFGLEGVKGSLHDNLKSIEHHKRQMSFAALQHFLTIGTAPNGSRATAQTQHGFFISASKHLADQVSQAMSSTTIARLARYNFGPDCVVPKLTVKNIKSEDFSNIQATLASLAQSGLIISEDNLREYIREKLDLPEESDQGIVSIKGEAVTPEGEVDPATVTGKGSVAPGTQGAPPMPGAPGKQGKGFGKSETVADGQGLMRSGSKNRTNLGGTGKAFSFATLSESRKSILLLKGLLAEAEGEEEKQPTYAVDFDGTLATQKGFSYDPDHTGEPIPAMVKLVKGWLADGINVVIWTARVSEDGTAKRKKEAANARGVIQSWCRKHIGRELEVTAVKEPYFDKFFDDKAQGVKKNTGQLLSEVYLARHGKTSEDGADDSKVSGWRPVPLDDEGREQVEALAAKLDGLGIAEIYTSDIVRAMSSAAIIAAKLGIPVIQEPGLRSWNLGDVSTMPPEEARTLIQGCIADQDREPVSGAETYREYLQRTADTMKRISARAEKKKKPILAMGHSWTDSSLPEVLEGLAANTKPQKLQPGDVKKLEHTDDGWTMKKLSDTGGFLPDTMTPDTASPDTIIQAGDEGRAMIVHMDARKKKEPPKHFDLAEAVGTTKRAAAEIGKVLLGSAKVKMIASISREAVNQLKRGLPVSQLHFSAPVDLAHRLQPIIDRLHAAAKQQAMGEVRRQLHTSHKFSDLFYSEDQPRDDHGRFGDGNSEPLANIAARVDTSNGPVGIGAVSATVYRSGDLGAGDIYFAESEKSAQEYRSLHPNDPVTKYEVNSSNTLAARNQFQLYSSQHPGKNMNDAILKADKRIMAATGGKGNSTEAWRQVQGRMMATARAAGYDSVIFTSPPAPAVHEFVSIKSSVTIKAIR